MIANSTSARNKRLEFCKTFSEEHHEWPRRSLIDDARKDSLVNQTFDGLRPEEEEEVTHHVIIKLDGGVGIADILNKIKDMPHDLVILQPRKMVSAVKCKGSLELLLVFKARRRTANQILAVLEGIEDCETTLVSAESQKCSTQDIWFPKHVSELDQCQHLVIKFEPELRTDHPGFHDENYKKRRHEVASLAFQHRHSQPIPRVTYSEDETKTWQTVYITLKGMLGTTACREHITGIRMLEDNGLFSPDFIPQLEDVSNFLKKKTGFRLRPVAGLLSARDFLASLAFRIFQCTQYIRHPSKPLHTAEPDVVHELLGHMPMLTDPDFAEFSQEIGLASIGVSDADIEKLATLYWFSVEFGLCLENGEKRAYGAGLLSAYGELEHALSDVPEHRVFEPSVTAVTTYTDEDYQPLYFVAQSLADMKRKLREYTKTFKRDFEVICDPYTESLKILRDRRDVDEVLKSVDDEMLLLRKLLQKVVE